MNQEICQNIPNPKICIKSKNQIQKSITSIMARSRIKINIEHTTAKQSFHKEQQSRIIQLLHHTFEHNISFHLHDDLSTHVLLEDYT